MFRKIFFWGLSAGALSALASVIFSRIHQFATYTDFSRVASISRLVAINILACLVAACGYWLSRKGLKRNGEIVFNLLFSILSFASITVPLSVKLPLDIQYPELFPGLVIPMHFFPALSWFTIRPLFNKEIVSSIN